MAYGAYLLLRQATGREVHAVWHDNILSLIAQGTEIFSCTAADRPYLIAGGDVLHQQLDGGFLQLLAMDGIGNVDIELGVVGEHQRYMQTLPQHPGQHCGRDGTVAMDQINVTPLYLSHQLRRQRKASPIAHQLRHVNAGIAQHRERVGTVVGVGIVGRYHSGAAIAPLDDGSIVDDRVGHAVNHRREGIVNKTYASFLS